MKTLGPLLIALMLLTTAGCGDTTAPYIGTFTSEQYFLEIFVRDTATERQLKKLEAVIHDQPGVESVYFIDKDEALERMRQRFGDNAYLLDAMSGNPLPASFRVEFSNGPDCDAAFDELKRVGIVDNTPNTYNGIKKLGDTSYTFDEDMTFQIHVEGSRGNHGNYEVEGTTLRLTYSDDNFAGVFELLDDDHLEEADTVPQEFRRVYLKQ